MANKKSACYTTRSTDKQSSIIKCNLKQQSYKSQSLQSQFVLSWVTLAMLNEIIRLLQLMKPIAKCTAAACWCDERLLQGYKVFYTLTPDLPISLWTVHVVEGSMLTTIPNLLTNRTYSIKVLAYTEVGDGPHSEQIQVKMQQGGITLSTYFLYLICQHAVNIHYRSCF